MCKTHSSVRHPYWARLWKTRDRTAAFPYSSIDGSESLFKACSPSQAICGARYAARVEEASLREHLAICHYGIDIKSRSSVCASMKLQRRVSRIAQRATLHHTNILPNCAADGLECFHGVSCGRKNWDPYAEPLTFFSSIVPAASPSKCGNASQDRWCICTPCSIHWPLDRADSTAVERPRPSPGVIRQVVDDPHETFENECSAFQNL